MKNSNRFFWQQLSALLMWKWGNCERKSDADEEFELLVFFDWKVQNSTRNHSSVQNRRPQIEHFKIVYTLVFESKYIDYNFEKR